MRVSVEIAGVSWLVLWAVVLGDRLTGRALCFFFCLPHRLVLVRWGLMQTRKMVVFGRFSRWEALMSLVRCSCLVGLCCRVHEMRWRFQFFRVFPFL